MSTEHKRGPRTSHIQIWAYPSPHPHQNYYHAVAAFVNFEAIQITWLRDFSICRFIKIVYSPFSSDTTVYRLPSQLLYLSVSHRRSEVNDIVYLEQRRSDTIDEKRVTLIYDFETLFSEWIRRWNRNNAVVWMQLEVSMKRELRSRVIEITEIYHSKQAEDIVWKETLKILLLI